MTKIRPTTTDDVTSMEPIQTCMRLSCLAYKDLGTTTITPSTTHLIGAFDGRAVITTLDGGRVVIAFRGTDSFLDWGVNMFRFQTRFACLQGARVHAGFHLQHLSLWEQIKTHLARDNSFASKIFVTGHSLGGALATLFAAELACLVPRLSVTCYVFGSPRVGNRSFAEGVQALPNLSMLRINNQYDIVPWGPWCGFTHTHDVVSLSVKGLRWYNFRTRHSISRMYAECQKKQHSQKTLLRIHPYPRLSLMSYFEPRD
jgi:predicted lipase